MTPYRLQYDTMVTGNKAISD